MAIVDVVIVAYKNADQLKKCLSSLANQSCEHAIYVADNGHDRETKSMVEALFPEVTMEAMNGNVGFGAASNLAFSLGTSPVVLFLNPDTSLRSEFDLQACASLLESDGCIGLVGAKLVTASGKLDHACKRGEPTPWRSIAYAFKLNKIAPKSRLFSGYLFGWIDEDSAGPVEAINGAFMMATRTMLASLDYVFDPRFWMYMEDLDLCRRVRERGLTVWYEPTVSVFHAKAGTEAGRRGARTTSAFYRSAMLYYGKWYPGAKRARPDWLVLMALLWIRSRMADRQLKQEIVAA